MKLGLYNEVISETSPFPGSIGDSLAESARLALLDGSYGFLSDKFITDKGFLRHPDSPWREDDISWDQLVPFYLMCRERGYDSTAMKIAISKNTPLKNPTVWALLNGHKFLLSICILIQGLLFKLPYRWDDGKKWFAKNDATCDYINYFWTGLYAHPWSRLVPREILFSKIKSYYKDELEKSENIDLTIKILSLYYFHISTFWKSVRYGI